MPTFAWSVSLSPTWLALCVLSTIHLQHPKQNCFILYSLSPGQEDCPGEGNGYLLQYSCLENPIDKGVWQARVHGITRARHNWVTNTFTFRIKNVSPASAYRDFCLALVGKKTLTHLALEGSVHGDKMLLLLLCEVLKHPRCNLQYLRWVLCHCCPQREKDAVSSEQNRGLPYWSGTMLNRGAYSQILTEYRWYVSQ